MSDIAIRAEGLAKLYHVGVQKERYGMLTSSIPRLLKGGWRKPQPAGEFWALDDVSFDVARGEVVGLIGHNGAGKSTLLKVLSRITEPTRGTVTMHGRVGSLLEVGTGFHVELTGRENVFLNGAILGMSRSEIQRNFDEIVAFAEVEQFIDTAVKHYSSGMQLRLAFSVAAHLQPEILLVDEVLAVGDMRFQQKCMGKMEDVAGQGRTVIFVSHNLSAVKELCRSAIVLERGRVAFRGGVNEGIARYTAVAAAHDADTGSAGWSALRPAGGMPESGWAIAPEEPLAFRAALSLPAPVASGFVYCIVQDASGATVVHQRRELATLLDGGLAAGRHEVAGEFPPLWLAPGLYNVHLKFIGRDATGHDVKFVSERQLLDVTGWSSDHARALLAPSCDWTVLEGVA